MSHMLTAHDNTGAFMLCNMHEYVLDRVSLCPSSSSEINTM